jgi:parallel beta-helix repeat protein
MITGNTATNPGGGIYCRSDSSPTITNCTISDNLAVGYGGGISCWYSSAAMTNCILWNNTAPDGHEIALMSTSYPSTLTVRYSNVQGGSSEAYIESGCTLDLDVTNIDADPLFVSGSLGDYYLSQMICGQAMDSPCVDAGSDTAENLGLDRYTTRTDGMPDTGIVDMGYHSPYVLCVDCIDCIGNDVVIYWNALSGVSYTVQWSDDMSTWNDVLVGETDNWTDIGGALESQRYYRVVE